VEPVPAGEWQEVWIDGKLVMMKQGTEENWIDGEFWML